MEPCSFNLSSIFTYFIHSSISPSIHPLIECIRLIHCTDVPISSFQRSSAHHSTFTRPSTLSDFLQMNIIARTELLPNIRHLKWPRESPTDAVSLTTPVPTEPVSSRHPVRTISNLIAAANYGASSNWRHWLNEFAIYLPFVLFMLELHSAQYDAPNSTCNWFVWPNP